MGAKGNLPTAYMDTSLLVALHYKGGSSNAIKQALATRDWWKNERRNFRIYTSAVTEDELLAGVYQAQVPAVATARRLVYLPLTRAVHELAADYISARLVPASQEMDTFHLAVSTVHRVDYLLSWNQAHLANPQVQRRLQEINDRLGLRTPWLVTPDSIPKVRLGQTVARKD